MTFRALAIAAVAFAGLGAAVFVPPDVHDTAEIAQVQQVGYTSVYSTYLSTVDQGATYAQIVFDHAPIDHPVDSLPFMRTVAA